MRDILFMIGNGFDLNCGMKTGYRDFYIEYIKNQAEDSALIKMFKQDIEQNIQNWGDYEIAMGKQAAQFETKDDFLECVNDFSYKLKLYLKDVEKHFRKYIKGKEDAIVGEVINSLTTFDGEVSKNVTNELSNNTNPYFSRLSFISFNYTDIGKQIIKQSIQRRLGVSDINLMFHHVHGNIEDLTLGCDNEGQIKARFDIDDDIRLSFVKPYFNDEYDLQRKNIAMQLIDGARFICAYGLTLGESDLMWRRKIIEWLKESEENHFFLYFYKYASHSFRTIHERMVFEKNVKNELFREWNVELTVGEFNRFHVVCGKNIFNVAKVVEQEKQKIAEEKKRE